LNNKSRKLVVMGNGMAGARVVEEILKRAPEQFEITMFGAEPYGNYNRILLSNVLNGSQAATDIFMNPLAWYEENRVRLHAGVRATLNERVDVPFGRRAIDAELKGYPVRIEIGPRDIAENRVVMVRRVTGEKIAVPIDGVVSLVTAALEADQKTLYEQALTRQRQRTADVTSVPEAIEAASAGWARLPWSEVGSEGEAELNAQGVTVRCLVRADGGVPDSEDEPDLVAVVGRAY